MQRKLEQTLADTPVHKKSIHEKLYSVLNFNKRRCAKTRRGGGENQGKEYLDKLNVFKSVKYIQANKPDEFQEYLRNVPKQFSSLVIFSKLHSISV